MKVPKKAAKHFVYGTYYINNDTDVQKVESISVKKSKVNIIIKKGEKPITKDLQGVEIEKIESELILKPSSQNGVDLVMEFDKILKELHDTYGNEYFKFQYSGIHVSCIQKLRKSSGIFTEKRSGKSLDSNDVKVASSDDFYKKLLDETIIEYNSGGKILEKVKVENGNEKIILKVIRRDDKDDNVFLVPF